MREYKIVEEVNGHGDSRFQIKIKCGWGCFSYWSKFDFPKSTMKEAIFEIEDDIRREKYYTKKEVKEYMYTDIPKHIPEEQVGKFMKISEEK